MTTGRINQVAPSDDAGAHEPAPGGGGGQRARGRRSCRGGGSARPCGRSRRAFGIPEPGRGTWPEPRAWRHAGGRRPRLRSPPRAQGGRRAEVRLFRVIRVAFAGNAAQETDLRPALARRRVVRMKGIVRGRFPARAGSPPTQTIRAQLTRPHGSRAGTPPARPPPTKRGRTA